MQTKPRISIITPSFNQAPYLEQTMQSVLEQDYPDIEYMLVDGGSTDGSLEIIQCYANRLDWWVSEPDLGQADAINKGLARASGDIVAWLNSDDLYQPGALEKVADVFKAHPEVGLIYGDVLSIDQDSKVFNEMRFQQFSLTDLLVFNIISQPGVFMRRDIQKQAGLLDTRFHYLLDHHLWIRMAHQASMHYLPKTLAAARYHPDAKNIGQAANFGQDAYAIMDWLQGDPEMALLLAPVLRRAWAGAHRFNARYLLDGERPRQSLFAYLRSLWCHPGTALKEWHRMVYALLSLFGLKNLKSTYMKARNTRNRQRRPELYD
jgi:glycosyltransferase involved in cell wall biosynthesis